MKGSQRRSKKKGKKSKKAGVLAAQSRSASFRRPKAPSRKELLNVPAILLEGDTFSPTIGGGPDKRYAVGPSLTTPPLAPSDQPRELPEAYGTKSLFLLARDPHWLYAHWDLTREQLRHYNALSADRHLILRVYSNHSAGVPLTTVHVHPESRNWFVHVPRGGSLYTAELGYCQSDGKWVTLSTSKPTLTPPEGLSEDTSARFATVPIPISFEEFVQGAKGAVGGLAPVAESAQQVKTAEPSLEPEVSSLTHSRWTPMQEKALAEAISLDNVRGVGTGSLGISEIIRRQHVSELGSAAAAQFSQPMAPSGDVSGASSPFGGMERKKSFWFNVNAELIIYGATEPDATVTIGSRQIKLRSDGTFSYRFALPDGKYDLPVIAVSVDRADGRCADLAFSRRTEYRGEVRPHPQDPLLKTPEPSNLT